MNPSTRQRPVIREATRNLRKASTKSEAILWTALRSRRLGGRKFRHQHPVGRFVVDFYCAEEHLAVEIDGSIHDERQVADRDRQRILESEGMRFVRLPARLVEDDIDSTLEIIANAFAAGPSPAQRERDGSPKANRGEG